MKKTFILLFLVILLPCRAGAQIMTTQLANGLKVVLVVNRSSPMIASVVTVNAGSANETKEINGISHMLEHLLFNGTSSRTQEQIYYEQDYYGIYNNAHTARDYTNYIVLAEKDFIDEALDIQSDMLFRSIFPKNKFEKEKGIILNELAKSRSGDSFWADDFFNRKLYKGTPYSLTVLGTPSSIKRIKRKQVVEYYQQYYKPNNMTALIMGDFDSDKMLKKIENYFGAVSPGKISGHKTFRIDPVISDKTFAQKIRVNNTYLSMGFAAPNINDNDFYAFDLLTVIINMNIKAGLNKRLKNKKNAQILEISSNFNFFQSLSSFTITAVLLPDADVEMIKKEVTAYLKEFIHKKIDKDEIKGILTSLDVNEQFLFERPHYYGMMKGRWIAAGGWEFAKKYIDRLTDVDVKALKQAGQQYFNNPVFLTCISSLGEKAPEFVEQDYYAPVKTEKKQFTHESIQLVDRWKKEGASERIKKGSMKKNLPEQRNMTVSKLEKADKTVLKNGLTVIINSNPDSEVFAIHLLVKNRTSIEPSGKEGIADLLHRMIERRTRSKDRKQLQDALHAIGAVLKTKDNPYIPYDDYYTSRKFSYVRFETIDRFYKEAIHIFSDIVLNPSFLTDDIKEVKAEMLSLIQKNNENPSKIAGNLFHEQIFKGNPVSRRINGTIKSISSITQNDLKKFLKYYFSPNNLIISAATSINKKKILEEFKKYFAALTRHDIPLPSQSIYPLFSKPDIKKVSLNKAQSYIRMGVSFVMSPDENAGLRILASVLTGRLSQQLREVKGLAYSVGAGFSAHNTYGLFEIAAGTTRETLHEAEEEILKEIEKLKKENIKPEHLNKLINFSNSRRLMRSLSRISQCYQLGVNEFYGKPLDYGLQVLKEIKKIKPEAIRQLAKKYLKTEHMVKIIIE